MAVKVLAVLKVAVVFLGASATFDEQAGVHAVPVVGGRKDAYALRYPMCINSAFRGMTIRIEEICV